ncbi:MAG: T9SS C-terminal target domain-containing protein [Sphingobacteriales bacterium]|nr:MAG: T9SS C-terminal target domain-containing protein [Sphingobacteriales bacterium]TAF81773.1 MAG: T9SS C-terminal target domain-containing protein [Sphingobacteriales bacterium]
MKKILFLLLILITNFVYAINYYVRPSGNNANSGKSPTLAWQTLENINNTTFLAGDNIYLEEGFTYYGNIYLNSTDIGTATNPITITSWNAAGALTNKATINAGNLSGIYAYNTAGIKISDLNIFSSTQSGDGISFYCDLSGNVKLNYIFIENIEIQGFRYGVRVGSWNNLAGYTNVTIRNSDIHDNVVGGILTYAQTKLAHQNFTVSYCKAYNNFGDLTNTTTNTGSGIIIAGVDGANVNHCITYNNGQNNRNLGGGPVGIWCYEANNVVMEYNESYNNKAGLTLDGGGFDIDGGSTNCIMQYNYSHGNEGAGFLFAQFSGATTMNNNTCRYNISENDGRKNSFAGIELFAAPGHSISNTYIYNNTIFVSPASTGSPSAIVVLNGTTTTNTQIKNNILITTGGLSIVKASSTSGIILNGNNYWSSGGTFNINWRGTNYASLAAFKATRQETGTGFQLDPMLVNPNGGIIIGNTNNLSTLTGYQLQHGSPMINAGLTIANAGTNDFYGNTIPINSFFDIGAHEYNLVLPVGLIDFKAKATSNGNVLTWKTLSEKNNNGFEILRSVNGVDFDKIYFIKSIAINGNSSSVLNYTFNDITNDEIIYYKLNQIDFNGKTTPYAVIKTEAEFATENFVFPNPLIDNLNIIITSGSTNKVNIGVYNHRGILMVSKEETLKKGKNSIKLIVNNLEAGWYLLKVNNAFGLPILSRKIIKL